jgi:hypothetical protein
MKWNNAFLAGSVFLLSASLASAQWNATGQFNSWGTAAMTESPAGVFKLTHSFAAPETAGWKVNDGLGGEYPGGFGEDSWYQVPAGNVDFVFDTNIHDDGWRPRQNQLYTTPAEMNSVYYLVGDFQAWDAGAGIELKDDGSVSGDTPGDGIYIADVVVATAGMHYWKVLVTSGSWDRQITMKSAVNSGVGNSDFPFFTTAAGQTVRFYCDRNLNRLKVEPPTSGYTLFGTYNSWNQGDGIATETSSGVYRITRALNAADAGNWKALHNNGYESWPGWKDGHDAWYECDTTGNVDFYLDTNPQGDGWLPDANLMYTTPPHIASSYVAVGDFQDEAGETGDWIANSAVTAMTDDGSQPGDTAGDGIYKLRATISTAGTYVFKVALDGTWDRQIRADGPNGSSFDTNDKFTFTTTAPNQQVDLFCDVNTNRIYAETVGASIADWVMID